MGRDFATFFRTATKGSDPYPFQEEFANSNELPHLLRAPTGAGKTATAILGWLYRWATRPKETPRRLIYCLPMRVLVEQSAKEAKAWIKNLNFGTSITVHVLMGGVDTEDWHLFPEKPAILIGTQDMLLSRVLNRGYAASPFHWPIDFGLLNNDCLWVFDEPQLMANGVSTSAQLAGLRNAMQSFGSCPSIWMSATLEPEWLDTIDFKGKFPAKPLELDERDYDPNRILYKRMTAEKILHSLGASSSKDMKDVVKAILTKHVAGTQTLVVLNTVDRAKAVYYELIKIRKKSETPRLLLVHSRFRPSEREKLNEQLQEKEEVAMDRIIVATQVVEAGVDISARTLITELCPWASMVQRIGRCHRYGEWFDQGLAGQVFWIELDDKLAAPYTEKDIAFPREKLHKLEGQNVSPKALDDFKAREPIKLPFEHKHVLRRRDLLDLFDTTPDLSGNDIDIQRFVRSDDPDTDVQIFWREISGAGPADDEPAPHRRELCNVPVGQARGFLEKIGAKRIHGFIWDHLDGTWIKLDPKQLRPGLAILLPTVAGGYSELGWDSASTAAVEPCALEERIPADGTDSDWKSAIPFALTIRQHTDNVCKELEELLASLGDLVPEWRERLTKSARWHDLGKAHSAFQCGVRKANSKLAADQLWAKSGSRKRLVYSRKYFRHELASALVALQRHEPFEVAYLIAAHHGKVRLSIRSLPDETPPPDNQETMFALGVHHGDQLPEVDLGGESCPAITVDLTPMRLGGDRSWTANALKLLGELGPFKLAYLEALLRAADVRASKKEAINA
jgi:CRISPR-associated endonuclease/helicase Cas3